MAQQTTKGSQMTPISVSDDDYMIAVNAPGTSPSSGIVSVGDLKTHVLTGALTPGNNLSDVGDAATARTNIGVDLSLYTSVSDLASTTAGLGAALVGIQDTGGYFTSATVEGALQELGAGGGGGGFTQEQIEDFVGDMVSGGSVQTLITVSYDDINGELDFVVNNDLASFSNATSNFVAVGDSPTWTGTHDFRTATAVQLKDTLTTIADNIDTTKLIAFDAAAITTGNTRTITMADANVDLADMASATDLASTSASLGAALVGINDAGALITATTVEGALQELAAGGGTDTKEARLTVYNDTGATLTKGTVVYISGYNLANTSPTVAKANATSSATMPAVGVCVADINNAATGEVQMAGIVVGIDTSSGSENDPIYVSTTAGAFTITPPTGATNVVQEIGRIGYTHATSGEIIVQPRLGGNPLADTSAWTDVNDNEILAVGVAASAVNHVKVTNAATGNPAKVSATGDDTNIDLQLEAKGTGVVKGSLVPLAIAISDETTALTTGTAKLTYYLPRNFTVQEIYGCVTTAPTGATLIIDVNHGGATIMTTNKIVIDAGENSTATAATPPTLTTTALTAGTPLTFDIDQVGSTVAGAGAKVTLLGYWT